MAQGDLAAALKSYRDSLAIQSGWRNPIPATPAGSAICRCRITRSATCRSRRATLRGALKSYRDSLAITERLAKSDPGNAGWQRDLSVSHHKVGDVQVAQGDPAARSSPTATASPSRSVWRNPIPATPAGSAICRCRTTRSATCRWRRATWRRRCKSYRDSLAHQRASGESRIPATPAGSAICRCRQTRSATCRWRKATWRAR